MINELDPVVGNWYSRMDKGQKFEIVALDNDAGLLEIQHFDGDVEELSLDDWSDLDVEISEAPENWTGPVDIAEVDDLGTDITDTAADDWSEPLSEYREPEDERIARLAGEGTDDWGEGNMKEEPLDREP